MGNSFTTCSRTRTGAPAVAGSARGPHRLDPAHGQTGRRARSGSVWSLGCLAGHGRNRGVRAAHREETRVRMPGSSPPSGGFWAVHSSLAYRHRGAKLHPGSGEHQARRHARNAVQHLGPVRDQRRHRLEQRLRVRVPHAREQRARVAGLHDRPAYITITRSARPAMTPRSCVISSMLMCSSSLSRSSSVRICPWIVTSSAVVGSSAISNCGSQTRAVAMTTRWRRPPDS